MSYYDFLKSKMKIAPDAGFNIDAGQLSPVLKPHERDSALWMIRGGCRALFSSFGLGKTITQLEVMRIINRYSNPGELVLDPFGGLMTVPYMAVKMGRRGYGIELNPDYFQDGVKYLQAIERDRAAPTLFDMEDVS